MSKIFNPFDVGGLGTANAGLQGMAAQQMLSQPRGLGLNTGYAPWAQSSPSGFSLPTSGPSSNPFAGSTYY